MGDELGSGRKKGMRKTEEELAIWGDLRGLELTGEDALDAVEDRWLDEMHYPMCNCARDGLR